MPTSCQCGSYDGHTGLVGFQQRHLEKVNVYKPTFFQNLHIISTPYARHTKLDTKMLDVIVKLLLASLDQSSQAAMSMLRTLRQGPTVEKDRGYAWVILIMACLSDSVHLFAMLSNLTVAHKDLFGISVQESGSIGSVHVGLLLLFGESDICGDFCLP